MENASCRTSHSIAGQCHTPIRLAATSKQLQLQLAFFRILTHAHCLSLRCRDVDREIEVHPRIVSHQFVDVHFAQCTCTFCTMHMHMHNAHFAQCKFTCTCRSASKFSVAQCKIQNLDFAQCSSKFSAAACHTSIKLAAMYLQLQLAHPLQTHAHQTHAHQTNSLQTHPHKTHPF